MRRPEATTSPPRSASAARSQASEGAGNGRPRTSLALSLSAEAARAGTEPLRRRVRGERGRAQRGSKVPEPVALSDDRDHGHRRHPRALVVDCCLDHLGLRRDQDLWHEAGAESVRERGHRHGGMREPTPGDRGRLLAPSSVSGLDQARGDDRGALAALLHERGDFVVLVPEVGGHLRDVADAHFARDGHRRHAERVGEERRPRIGGKRTRWKRDVAEDARHGALRLTSAQPDGAREHARCEHRLGRDPQVFERRVLEGSRTRPSAVTRRQRCEGLHEGDSSSVGACEPRREDEEERALVDIRRQARSQPRRAGRLLGRGCGAQRSEERRVADDDVERAVFQIGGERVTDFHPRIAAERSAASLDRAHIGVDADDVASRAETPRGSDEEVARTARGVDDADRARITTGVEQRLQRPVEQQLDEERWSVERAEAATFGRAQARPRLNALNSLASYRSSRKATC